jgi:hypothetical protein
MYNTFVINYSNNCSSSFIVYMSLQFINISLNLQVLLFLNVLQTYYSFQACDQKQSWPENEIQTLMKHKKKTWCIMYLPSVLIHKQALFII